MVQNPGTIQVQNGTKFIHVHKKYPWHSLLEKITLLDVLAMFCCLGPPTLFVTLSANDMHWPELIMQHTGCSYLEAENYGNAIELVKKDPLICAIHFERRLDALLKFVLHRGLQPLGKIRDHFIRIEFQNRGSPHAPVFVECWHSKCTHCFQQTSAAQIYWSSDFYIFARWTYWPMLISIGAVSTYALPHKLLQKKYWLPLWIPI